MTFSLQEFGPFRLGRWSWTVNFASFLVCHSPICYAPLFIISAVHHSRLYFIRPTYGIPSGRLQHELCGRCCWWSSGHSNNQLVLVGKTQL
jgi:hypothetical protein